MKIKIFWHIYLVEHWYSVVEDQLRILLTSGLYDACEEINIGCIGRIGGEKERGFLDKFIVDLYPKLKVKYYSQTPEEYEFPTIRLIEQDKEDYVGLYFHAKAVTKSSETVMNHWRTWLNEAILNRWRLHYRNIESGNYDVSSVNFVMHPHHFSGNFFWFNRRYIDRLPKIDKMDWSYRWGAEQWICKSEGRWFKGEKKEPDRDTYLIQYSSRRY